MASGKKPSAGDKGTGIEGRSMVVRVHRAKRRKASSTDWLARQLNDPYVAAAREQGWRARSAFKLMQIDDRFRLLAPGRRVVDLGCAPGGWTQVAVRRVRSDGAGPGKSIGRVVGIDLLETAPVAGAELLCGDFRDEAACEALRAALGGGADIVLSDMAAPTTGHAATDHLRIVALAEAAFEFARSVLVPGGAFIAKVFQGGASGELVALLKREFAELRHVKPPASRAESAETYVVATGFRGAPIPPA